MFLILENEKNLSETVKVLKEIFSSELELIKIYLGFVKKKYDIGELSAKINNLQAQIEKISSEFQKLKAAPAPIGPVSTEIKQLRKMIQEVNKRTEKTLLELNSLKSKVEEASGGETSRDELITLIVNKVNEQLEKFGNQVINRVKSLNEKVLSLEKDFGSLSERLGGGGVPSAQLETFAGEVDSKIKNLEEELSTLKTDLSNKISELRSGLTEQISLLNESFSKIAKGPVPKKLKELPDISKLVSKEVSRQLSTFEDKINKLVSLREAVSRSEKYLTDLNTKLLKLGEISTELSNRVSSLEKFERDFPKKTEKIVKKNLKPVEAEIQKIRFAVSEKTVKTETKPYISGKSPNTFHIFPLFFSGKDKIWNFAGSLFTGSTLGELVFKTSFFLFLLLILPATLSPWIPGFDFSRLKPAVKSFHSFLKGFGVILPVNLSSLQATSTIIIFVVGVIGLVLFVMQSIALGSLVGYLSKFFSKNMVPATETTKIYLASDFANLLFVILFIIPLVAIQFLVALTPLITFVIQVSILTLAVILLVLKFRVVFLAEKKIRNLKSSQVSLSLVIPVLINVVFIYVFFLILGFILQINLLPLQIPKELF